jgi:uncharacterized protein (TIGR03000 family)
MVRQRLFHVSGPLLAAALLLFHPTEGVGGGHPGWHGGPHGYYHGYYHGYRGYGWGYPGYSIGIGFYFGPGYVPVYPAPVCVAPAYPPGYVPTSALGLVPPPPAPAAPASSSDTTAHFRVEVPSDAVVWIEGEQMKQSGSLRQYGSTPLEAGKKYEYEIRARWTENGNSVERTKMVTFHAGDRLNVNFMPATGNAAR